MSYHPPSPRVQFTVKEARHRAEAVARVLDVLKRLCANKGETPSFAQLEQDKEAIQIVDTLVSELQCRHFD